MNFQFQISEHHSENRDVKQTVGRFVIASYILLFYQNVECCCWDEQSSSNDAHDAS